MSLSHADTSRLTGPIAPSTHGSLLTRDVPREYWLSESEQAEVRSAVTTLAARLPSPVRPEFHDAVDDARDWLPTGLHAFLTHFRRKEPAAAAIVHGLPVDAERLVPTPSHWRHGIRNPATRGCDAVLALCGLALGEPFGWETLQDGSLVQNILPMRGREQDQSGHGSKAFLEFHTEDGFHPERCDYLLLLGLRNPDAVPTIVSSVRDIELSADTATILGQPRYYVMPDPEHLNQLEEHNPHHPALAKMRQMVDQPEPIAVLTGDPDAPYLRVDRPFMRAAGHDPRAEEALEELMAELERTQIEVAVMPGDMLIVDNHVAVHGRRAFQPRFDGTDRWLKKLTVSRNLRRSRLTWSGSHRVLA